MGSTQESPKPTLLNPTTSAETTFYTSVESQRAFFPPPTLVDLYHRPLDLLVRRALEVSKGDLRYFVSRDEPEKLYPTFVHYGLGLDPKATFHYLQNILLDPNVRVRPPRQIQTPQELKAVYASVNMRRGWDLNFPVLRTVDTALQGPQIHPTDKKQLPPHLQTHTIAHILSALYLAGANSYFLRQGQGENSQMYQNLNQFANVKKLILPLPDANLSQVYAGGMLRLDRMFQVVHLEPTYANLLTRALENIYITSEFFQDKLRCLISAVQK